MEALAAKRQQTTSTGVGNVARTNAYTLDQSGGLLAVQEAMTRKIVTETKCVRQFVL